jgi:predicted nucleic acid-binding protein
MKISGVDLEENLVLDTSAYTHLRLGHSRVLDLVAMAAIVTVPVIVLGELRGGFELGSRKKENEQTLREFLAEPSVTVAPVDAATTSTYGRLYASLRRRGKKVPVNDLWIAALSITHRGHLLTLDADFERIDELSKTILSPEF